VGDAVAVGAGLVDADGLGLAAAGFLSRTTKLAISARTSTAATAAADRTYRLDFIS